MNKGFSLIELVIVFAIVGILATITYPGYHQYIIRAHRSDGQTALLDLANRLEHYYYKNNTYQTATIGAGETTDVLGSNRSNGGWYKVAIVSATSSAYTLQAIPQDTQGLNDTFCQTLTFNSMGEKGITAGPIGMPTSTTTQCW